jgi:hypothetical protein
VSSYKVEYNVAPYYVSLGNAPKLYQDGESKPVKEWPEGTRLDAILAEVCDIVAREFGVDPSTHVVIRRRASKFSGAPLYHFNYITF